MQFLEKEMEEYLVNEGISDFHLTFERTANIKRI